MKLNRSHTIQSDQITIKTKIRRKKRKKINAFMVSLSQATPFNQSSVALDSTSIKQITSRVKRTKETNKT
jgi:hypothetical protein